MNRMGCIDSFFSRYLCRMIEFLHAISNEIHFYVKFFLNCLYKVNRVKLICSMCRTVQYNIMSKLNGDFYVRLYYICYFLYVVIALMLIFHRLRITLYNYILTFIFFILNKWLFHTNLMELKQMYRLIIRFYECFTYNILSQKDRVEDIKNK